MNYTEALDFLNENFVSFQTAGRTAYHEGLDTIAAACRTMGNPQNDYMTIHIAGTNGKGSVAHMLAAVLQSAGYHTGLYTSPHLHSIRERIRIDGEPIPEYAVADFMSRYGEDIKRLGLSYFEMTTAMAFKWFSESEVEVAIIETGLGGRLDATNIITPAISIITNIGLEHCDILGKTVEAIAAEKAGIIKSRTPVVIGESDPESAHIFITRAAEQSAPIMFADLTYECLEEHPHGTLQRYTLRRIDTGNIQHIELDLLGGFQRKNLITARTAISVLRRKTQLSISTKAILEGLRNVTALTGLSGRWQIISHVPLTIADGGHNAHSFKETVRQLRKMEHDRLYMILGFAADKTLDTIFPQLPADAEYIFTQSSSPRAISADRLAEEATHYGLKGKAIADPHAALEHAKSNAGPSDVIFVGGSLYLVGEIL